MDDAVRAAMAKWPNVPACYGWLALDQRGDWRLTGDAVRHRGLIEFLNRNYDHDAAGNWYCQNGPQRVFVDLACTPWVLRLVSPNRLETHTGLGLEKLRAAFLDRSGRLLLEFQAGTSEANATNETQIGLVSDQDLPAMLDRVVDTQGAVPTESDLLAIVNGESRPLVLRWEELRLPLIPIDAASLGQRYGFEPNPSPA